MPAIVLGDDHAMVRAGLRRVRDAADDCRVVGEAGDGLEAVRLVERLKPDILVIDVSMPSMTGLEAARQLRGQGVPTRVPR